LAELFVLILLYEQPDTKNITKAAKTPTLKIFLNIKTPFYNS